MFRRGKLAFLSTKDDRIKLVNERINLTEKHLNELRGNFADCARRLAKERDAYDDLARGLKHYAEDEDLNESLSAGMKNLTNATTILADHMDMKVRRLELKIINELQASDTACKTTRDDLRVAVTARDKEVLKQRQMLELKSKFAANNSAADSELVKAKLEVSRTNKAIDDIIHNFEKRKLTDFKALLTDFILISLKFHTKALEALSASYYDVSNIDERYDLSEFQRFMQTKKGDVQGKALGSFKKKKKKKGFRSQSMDDLDRNELLSPLKRRAHLTRSSKNLTAAKDDELDEDEDDEEDRVDDDDDGEDDDDEDETEEASSQPDEEDSGSASDNEGAQAAGDAAGMRNKLSKPKLQLKDPFRAAAAATHVLSPPTERRPFAAKGKSDRGDGYGGRLVTVVESKKRTHASATSIDCTGSSERR